jgi:hypothetical protein
MNLFKSDLPAEIMDGIPLTVQVIRNVPNPALVFCQQLIEHSKKAKIIYAMNEPILQLTPEEEQQYNEAKICYMCDKSYTEEDIKVRDHCHITGKYRGASHCNCNIQATNPNFIPVYLHNNSHYDAHHLTCKVSKIPAIISAGRSDLNKFIKI